MMIDVTAGSEWTVLVSGKHTGGRFAVAEARERRGAAPPRHVHCREDEYIHVLEGRLMFDLDGTLRECPSGTGVFLPRGSEHTYKVESPEARLLIVVAPAGLEHSYRELCRPEPPVAEQQPIERLVAIAARYGVTITGPARPP